MPSGKPPFPFGKVPWKEFPIRMHSGVDHFTVNKCTLTDTNNNVTTLPTGSYVSLPGGSALSNIQVPVGFKGIVTWDYQVPGITNVVHCGSDWP